MIRKLNPVRKVFEDGSYITKFFGFVVSRKAFSSARYWEERYGRGGNSGSGSYGRLAAFKAEIINEFIASNGITQVIEFGVGDGNQLSLLRVCRYTGFDISETAVDRLRNLHAGDSSKTFMRVDDYDNHQAELVLSLDVLYHLVEDGIFTSYMRRLFQASTRYVVIYSSNFEESGDPHVKHRRFTDWIDKNMPDWRLARTIKNKYPYNPQDYRNTSHADFYLYEKAKQRIRSMK